MSFGLFGREFAFYFVRQHAALKQAVALLHEVLTDLEGNRERCAGIQALASEASGTAHEITRQLALTLMRPLERQDVYQLNLALKGAIDAVKAVAARVGLYGFAELRPAAGELTGSLVEMVLLTEGMIGQLRSASSAGELRDRLTGVRAEADAFLLVALGECYETTLDAPQDLLELIKWAHIFDRLEHAIDRADHVADVIESILLKRV
jgi:uncharacterized protein Yka (UPF0111/DUF47 family)